MATGVDIVVIIIACGSVATATLYALKKGITKCSFCGCSCEQNTDSLPQSNSDRNADVQQNMVKIFNEIRKSLTPRRLSKTSNPVEIAVQSSKQIAAEVLENNGEKRLSREIQEEKNHT